MGFSAADWRVPAMVAVDDDAVAALLWERFGVRGTARDLGSQQDRNYRVRTESGGDHVLKMANPVTDPATLRAQVTAAEHLATADPTLRLPRARAGADGDFVQRITVGGVALHCRLFDYVPGEPIMDSRYLAPRVVARLGELAGRTTASLAGLGMPDTDRPRLWDLRNAADVVEALAPFMTDTARAGHVVREARAAQARLRSLEARLPVQVIHGDLTDNNVVCEPGPDGRPMPVGVIDFGDLGQGWAVAELAVACASVLHHHGATPASVLPAVRAFHAVRPLAGPEADALWPLVVLRTAVLVVSGQYDVLQDPGNEYAETALDREWAMFEAAVSVPAEVMAAQLRAAVGHFAPPGPPTAAHPLLPDLVGGVETLDLSVSSTALHEGRWLDADAEDALAARALECNRTAVRTRHGEYRLTRSRPGEPDAATLALGTELRVAAPTALRAPWAGSLVRHCPDGVTLRTEDGWTLVLDGIDTGADAGGGAEQEGDGAATATTTGARAVPAGAPLGTVVPRSDGSAAHLQLARLADRPAPRTVPPDLADGWLAVCPDPATLFEPAVPAARTESGTAAASLLERRDRSFAAVQEHYFDAPPRIERGWREHLVDTEGRCYLDMLNNVTILGHGHPGLSEAVHQQWQRLNTNSRFHYESVVSLSERLAGLLPDGLDTVFLVNSGSEAVDLALRLAWAAAGRQDVVAVGEAYHGWTYASDAVSTSVADNPGALASRPDWVHVLPAPNSYRGSHRGPDAERYGPSAAESIRELARSGRPPAAFICEPYYGNAGGMALPDGYLRQVYEATRAAGGLCVADEVQVGYGRLGSHFWGFEQQGVVPDIVTVAKAMGNGHPLGAVITSKEIADTYRSQGYFFSSAGGSPVSSVVGLTVLDALRDEGLQENARIVGGHLRDRLLELAGRHPLIGAVHGTGLYLGVEFVRDRRTLEPAAEETAAICERLRELGVVVQPTSDRLCVLKIKPPLCLTRESADRFAAALDDTLTHGW
ncbi:aminotransferase [Streptomyces sp. NBC_01725]|uniref:aminotransferase n=1 Tax=Streptomyces sp. NBC_01725 TaxID=2975923 RepID=UPI002E282CA9|nr:aminotransferase [Streptomyces sp. NBC_01725]